MCCPLSADPIVEPHCRSVNLGHSSDCKPTAPTTFSCHRNGRVVIGSSRRLSVRSLPEPLRRGDRADPLLSVLGSGDRLEASRAPSAPGAGLPSGRAGEVRVRPLCGCWRRAGPHGLRSRPHFGEDASACSCCCLTFDQGDAVLLEHAPDASQGGRAACLIILVQSFAIAGHGERIAGVDQAQRAPHGLREFRLARGKLGRGAFVCFGSEVSRNIRASGRFGIKGCGRERKKASARITT